MTNGRGTGRPKGPGLAYTVLAFGTAAVLAVLSFTLRAPAPPTVAEFAPQARENIRDAPGDQTSGVEGGPGARGQGSPDEETVDGKSPDVPPIDVPRVRKCVGVPPRQTEDPQSPPCVPYWEGENGGETSRGVTRDTITVAIPLLGFEVKNAIEMLVDHFNRRYEFYGRQIKDEYVGVAGGLVSHPNPEDEQADAVHIDGHIKPFAAMATGIRYGAEHHFYEELARRNIVSVGGSGSLRTESRLRRSLYTWSFEPAVDTMQHGLGAFACSALAGRRPQYAGPGLSGADERVFGILVTKATDGTVPDVSPLSDALSSCGVGAEVYEHETSRDQAQRHSNAQNTVLRMSFDDVTSVICMCANLDLKDAIFGAAAAQGYQPEWIVSSFGINDLDSSFQQSPTQDQASRVFGLGFRNKLAERENMPWYWALRESDPNFNPSRDAYYHLQSRYSQLLLLASGIQMAGPQLTPATFASALNRTVWANPAHGNAPYFQARVGFDGGRHTMLGGEAALIWHDRARPGTIDPAIPGAVCYVDSGRRHGPSSWPEQAEFFDRNAPCL